MITKIFGPPGTGKTTTLLNHVKNFILNEKIDLKKIGYFAFTKKAAREAKERLLEDKEVSHLLSKDDLQNFRTLHSFAFQTIGMSEDRVMQSEHYEQIGRDLNLRVTDGGDESGYLSFNSEYFKLINKARVKNISVEEEFNSNEWSREIDYETLGHIYLNYNNFKKNNTLYDFNDMIDLFVKKKNDCQELEYIFIDEAQDLSPIQWNMFDVLKTKCKHLFLAGDDDQAIFAWAGADVKRFLNEPADEIVLDQSERVPLSVQNLSNVILSRIKTRKEKNYLAKKGNEGKVEYIYDTDNLDLTKDRWLILTRTTYRRDKICKQLREKSMYYKTKYGKSYDAKLYKCILKWGELTKGNTITISDCKDVFDYLAKDFPESELKNKSDVTIEDICYSKKDIWYQVFVNADQEECFYIRTMLGNKEKLSDEPRIEVSTIHGAKGGEEDNVILVLDNTKKIRDSVELNQDKEDEEHRVWYVGATRSKHNLYVLKPAKERYGYQL